jgi:hypothetical protein
MTLYSHIVASYNVEFKTLHTSVSTVCEVDTCYQRDSVAIFNIFKYRT